MYTLNKDPTTLQSTMVRAKVSCRNCLGTGWFFFNLRRCRCKACEGQGEVFDFVSIATIIKASKGGQHGRT